MRAAQQGPQEARAARTEDSPVPGFLDASADPNARFDRALETFAGLNGQLLEATEQMVTKLMVKDVERYATGRCLRMARGLGSNGRGRTPSPPLPRA